MILRGTNIAHGKCLEELSGEGGVQTGETSHRDGHDQLTWLIHYVS
jgi:hypothetical protein